MQTYDKMLSLAIALCAIHAIAGTWMIGFFSYFQFDQIYNLNDYMCSMVWTNSLMATIWSLLCVIAFYVGTGIIWNFPKFVFYLTICCPTSFLLIQGWIIFTNLTDTCLNVYNQQGYEMLLFFKLTLIFTNVVFLESSVYALNYVCSKQDINNSNHTYAATRNNIV